MGSLQRFLSALLLVCAVTIATSSAREINCPKECNCLLKISFQNVTCQGGKLKSIPNSLPSKAITTGMDLSMNKIPKIYGDSLASFKNLKVLILKKNLIKEINRDAFKPLKILTNLDLSENHISHLDEKIFEDNLKLGVVDLSYNPLFLPANGPFLISKSITRIHLASSNLTAVPHNAFNRMESLSRLNLTNNFLYHLPEKSLDLLRSLRKVELEGNPLRCDCLLKRTWNWSHHGNIEIAALCHEPDEMKGYPWDRVQDLECEPKPVDFTSQALYVIVTVLVAIMILVLAVLVFLIRRRKKHGTSPGKPRANRMSPTAPPPGEYIVVLPETKKDPVYEEIGKTKKYEREEAVQRYVDPQQVGARAARPTGPFPSSPKQSPSPSPRPTSVPTPTANGGYLAPIDAGNAGPIYINLKGPPLPVRCPDGGSAPPIEVPTAEAPSPPRLIRPCSIPLLQGCDFYEVVE